jgi:hypothetical protein
MHACARRQQRLGDATQELRYLPSVVQLRAYLTLVLYAIQITVNQNPALTALQLGKWLLECTESRQEVDGLGALRGSDN